jgi:diacylglycerol kinase (ATP)
VTRFTAVVNPTAGAGTGTATATRVAELLRAGGADVSLVSSTGHAHARTLAAEACTDGRTVLAVGGDGLAGCVAGAVVEAGGLLGLVPAGRGNDFARQLGLPAEPVAVARVLLAGVERTVDVIDAGGATVLGSVFAGVDSEANRIVNDRPRMPHGLVYPYAAVRALLTFRPVTYRLTLDGLEWAEPGYTVVVANSGYYGAGMHIVPTAVVDDGELDVLLIRAASRFRLIRALREVYSGVHLRRPEVQVRRAREVRLAADRPIPVYGDGEPCAELPLTVRVRARALRVLAPAP